MTKTNVTRTESSISSNQETNSSQIGQITDSLILANFSGRVISKQIEIQEAKEQARIHRKERAPKGMSKSAIMKRGNARAHGAPLEKSPPKINRKLQQIENVTQLEYPMLDTVPLSPECLEIIDEFKLPPEDKELLLNLTQAMNKNFSDDDIEVIFDILTFVPDIQSTMERPPQDKSAAIIAANTQIQQNDAKRLLDEMYDKLGPRSGDFITECVVSSIPKDYKKQDLIDKLLIMAFILACLDCIRRVDRFCSESTSEDERENNQPIAREGDPLLGEQKDEEENPEPPSPRVVAPNASRLKEEASIEMIGSLINR